jgi:hypothetical protein
MVRPITLVRAFSIVALAVGVLVWPATPVAHAADTDVLWQMDCGIDHFGPDDPIVHPGGAGDSHMHSFYGNTSTNANSNAASMLAAPSSCGRNMQTSDHSGYWIPSLYKKDASGAMTIVKNQDQNMFIYYQRPGRASGPKIEPFPVGFRMIAGNSAAMSPQPLRVTDWDCGGGGPEFASIPQCQANYSASLHAEIEFPNCWDGHSLDSVDHKSHMAYGNADSGVCPADHPVSLPQVIFEIDYPYNPGGPAYSLSSGSPYSMHGDFFAAWDSRVQNALVYGCLNTGLDCIDVNRNGDTLTAGDDNPVHPINLANYSSSQQALGDQTVAPKSPVPAPAAKAAALPDTGPAALVGGSLGLAVVGSLIYERRLRRRSLRQALVRSGRARR